MVWIYNVFPMDNSSYNHIRWLGHANLLYLAELWNALLFIEFCLSYYNGFLFLVFGARSDGRCVDIHRTLENTSLTKLRNTT